MPSLKDVYIPCGETFCLSDWRVYAQPYTAQRRRFKALRLELPVKVKLDTTGHLLGYEGDWLVEDEQGRISIWGNRRFTSVFKKEKANCGQNINR